MNREQLLAALDQAGETLKAMGEDFISLTFSDATDLVPHADFICSVQSRRYGPPISASGETPRKAFIKALAARSEKQAEAAIREQVEAEVQARLAKQAA